MRPIRFPIISESKKVERPAKTIEDIWTQIKSPANYDPHRGLDVRRIGGDGAEALWTLYHDLKTGLS